MELSELSNVINGMNSDELNALYETIKDARKKKLREKYDGIETVLRNYLNDLGKRDFGIAIINSCGDKFMLTPSEMTRNFFNIKVWHKEDDERYDELNVDEDWRE